MTGSSEPRQAQATGNEFDVFVSHASENKADVARPLTETLERRGRRVWLDEQELTLGDFLGRKIDDGLARSRFGVVILSPEFFAKQWPRRELDGLVARETLDGQKVILPVWHGVTAAEVARASPTLAARLAVDTSHGIEAVADAVERALNVASKDGPARVALQPVAPAPEAPDTAPVDGEDLGGVHDEVLDLLRKNDAIGLDQLLRRERGAFERAVNGVTDDHINHYLDEATVRDAGGRLAYAAQRRLASLIPLGLHQPGGIQGELRAHAGWMSRSQLRGGGMTWQEAWRWPWWLVGMSLGSLLCRLERYSPVGEMVRATWLNRYNEPEGFMGHPGEVGDAVARISGPVPPEGRQWAMPAWSWLLAELQGYAWLAERYPEWLADERDPAASLAEFDMIDGLADGFRSGGHVLALWSLQPDAASAFARRLYGDPHVRAEVSAAVGVDLETFDARAPEILADAQGIGMFPRTREVANILRTGNFR